MPSRRRFWTCSRTSLGCLFRLPTKSRLVPANAARLVKRAPCAAPPPRALRDEHQMQPSGGIAMPAMPGSVRPQHDGSVKRFLARRRGGTVRISSSGGAMQFGLAGRQFEIDRVQVEAGLRGVQPEAVRTHGVRIGGKLYPVKQVLARVTGLSRADFNSHQARQVLKRLGLTVVENNKGTS